MKNFRTNSCKHPFSEAEQGLENLCLPTLPFIERTPQTPSPTSTLPKVNRQIFQTLAFELDLADLLISHVSPPRDMDSQNSPALPSIKPHWFSKSNVTGPYLPGAGLLCQVCSISRSLSPPHPVPHSFPLTGWDGVMAWILLFQGASPLSFSVWPPLFR